MRFSLTLLSGFCALAAAVPVTQSEFDVNVAQGLRLLSLSEDVLEWHTEDEVLDLGRAKTNFFDVTDTYSEGEPVIASASQFRAAACTRSALLRRLR